MKVVFFGSSRYVTPVMEMLKNNFDLPLVVTTEQGSSEPVPFFCKTRKVNYVSVKKSADLIGSYQIAEAEAPIGVVADFGLIIPQRVIDNFPQGLINIHPSLLPKYRGPTPAQNAILNGETQTGVTIIKLDKYMDHGPVLVQVEEEIKSNDTAKSLYERLFKISTLLLEKTLFRIEAGQVPAIPQNHEHATFTKILTRDDGFVDFKNFFSGKNLFERMVRAYYPWPGVWTKANITENTKDIRIIKFLPDKKIQVEGGREMSYKDFINGYPFAYKNLISFLKTDI